MPAMLALNLLHGGSEVESVVRGRGPIKSDDDLIVSLQIKGGDIRILATREGLYELSRVLCRAAAFGDYHTRSPPMHNKIGPSDFLDVDGDPVTIRVFCMTSERMKTLLGGSQSG